MASNENPEPGSDPSNSQDRSKHSNLSRHSRLEDARNLLAQKHKEAAAFSRDNRPYIHDQVRRVNASYSPPWYCVYFTPAEYRFRTLEENMIYMCSQGGRVMTDAEASAFSEIMFGSMDTRVILRYGVMVAAAAMTARGAHRFRFPFFTPQFKNKAISPVGASPAVTWGWHSLRFVTYYGVLRLMVETPLDGYNIASTLKAMRQDSRLSDFSRRMRSKLQNDQVFDDSFRSYEQERQASGQDDGSYSQEPDYQSENRSQRTASTWASYRQQAQEGSSQSSPQTQDQYQSYETRPHSPSTQPQERSSLWDTPSATQDIDDDASPVAASFRKQQQRSSSSAGGGSAWDRVRKQAGADTSQSSQPAPRVSWSSGESENRRAKTYGNDDDTSAGKSKAQEQFDELVERERKAGDDGGGDSQGSWRKW